MSFAGISFVRWPIRSAARCAVAAVICTLALSPSALANDEPALGDSLPVGEALAAADGSFDNSAFIGDDDLGAAGQLQAAQQLIERWRDVNKFLALCIRNDHVACRKEATQFVRNLEAQGMTVATWARLAPIRNNMYFYLLAPSLRHASAIAHQGRDCSQWNAFAQGDGTSLSRLLSDATQEVGQRNGVPESKELTNLRALIGPCVAAAGGD